MPRHIAIIGSGFSGLSAAAYLSQAGHHVDVFEKHDIPGGRARQFATDNGYIFDMGPSWYWMPDIIENFFNDFGCSSSAFYTLQHLDPQFEMVFKEETLQVPHSYEELRGLFERIEPGAGKRLDAFMKAGRYKYEVGMKDFVNKPCLSWAEFISPKIISGSLKLDLFTNFRSYVSRYFRHPYLRTLMEFPVIFLGASPKDIPALYSMMNYGGYGLGTWYPKGGFYELVKAMKKVAEKQGAIFHFNSEVEKIVAANGRAEGIVINGEKKTFDMVIASSDYHHSESLLDSAYRNYDERYWSKKTFAPSTLICYLGINEKIPGLKHHTLFFENDMDAHLRSVYKDKSWPSEPLFYACCPSRTDDSVAPAGHENIFLLMPLATGIQDNEEKREVYIKEMLGRIEKHSGIKGLEQKIDYKRSYCINDFVEDYHAYAGNAYGLANTLRQTAVLKPSIKNKKLGNLYYTGQLTVPGPGVPPAIISGKIVAGEINKLKHESDYEKAI